jgi:uncharacterized metal-binding protein
MKGINHDRGYIFALCLLITIFLYFHISIYELTQVFLFWVIGTLYLSPDLDARYSRSKLRIGHFRYLFIFTKHRGFMHNLIFGIFICVIMGYFGYWGARLGILGSAMVHIIFDSIF